MRAARRTSTTTGARSSRSSCTAMAACSRRVRRPSARWSASVSPTERMDGQPDAGPARHKPALCVSIHDVAPATWDECARLAQAMREVAELPLTWLVVPQYHRAGGDPARMESGLGCALARGDELALH